MFSNKTALLTAFVLLTSTGCVNLKNEAQQAQINTLTTDLAQAQETNQKTQAELAKKSAALQTSQDKIEALDALLIEAKKVKATKDKITRTADNKKIKRIEDKTVLGQTEWAYIATVKSNYKARIDTGAATSSLNAVDIELFERDGKKWVRFNLSHEKGLDPQLVEAKVERFAKISQSSNPGVTTERPVIKLHVRIGDIEQQSEFTLADRLHMEYPVLIGRTFLQDVILVDVSKEYIHQKSPAKTEK